MKNQHLRFLGYGAVVAGMCVCLGQLIYRYTSANALVAKSLVASSEHKWDAIAGFSPKSPFGTSTHQAGPFTLDPEDAPFSFHWHMMDGGHKFYRFRVVLYGEDGTVNWIHSGNNMYSTYISPPEETVIVLPVSTVQRRDRYMLIASVTDMNGKPIQVPAQIEVRQHAPDPKGIVMGPTGYHGLLMGFFILVAGVILIFATKDRRSMAR